MVFGFGGRSQGRCRQHRHCPRHRRHQSRILQANRQNCVFLYYLHFEVPIVDHFGRPDQTTFLFSGLQVKSGSFFLRIFKIVGIRVYCRAVLGGTGNRIFSSYIKMSGACTRRLLVSEFDPCPEIFANFCEISDVI